ncbi:MAG: 6-carboxytetrahydropterin synthase QueD [Calditrichaeota bacterium]|nr:6-carboxytetrahydropterin synthase QueD [Calditrichota bacterium]
MFKISAKTSFAAAHRLREYEGACENLHGHNWRIKATIGSEKLDELGMVYDFKNLKKNLQEIIDLFDHQFVNQIPPFDKELNPTSENLAKFIFKLLGKKLPEPIRMISVEVGESDNYTAIYEE